ncbi:MAG: nicotinate (nicotinamide) nucleotide adenylyltransferase [Candidatus Levybacteria bacterium]|nr:nicotinate (nicotinamide) nucleotide adenylyltransferase [Candidatus Levybacteria bacterium]
MKIGILGGSFDPPHTGQYFVLQQILELRKDINKILIIPAFRHQWKKFEASTKDRLAMTKFLLQNKTEISEIEIKRRGISYAIDTIKEIKKETGAQIFWIVGSDIIPEFHRWEKSEELASFAKFLVFPRDPYHLPTKLPKGFELITGKNLVTTNISSTIIRRRIKEGKSIEYLVPKEVEEYIRENNLYKT